MPSDSSVGDIGEESIKRFLEDLSKGSKREYTLEGIIGKWEVFVVRVENGYPLDTIDDYTNDLSIRDIIQRIREISSASLKKKLEEIVDPLDKRYKAATIEINSPILGHPSKSDKPWWFRVPKKCNDDLKQELITYVGAF